MTWVLIHDGSILRPRAGGRQRHDYSNNGTFLFNRLCDVSVNTVMEIRILPPGLDVTEQRGGDSYTIAPCLPSVCIAFPLKHLLPILWQGNSTWKCSGTCDCTRATEALIGCIIEIPNTQVHTTHRLVTFKAVKHVKE